jgi:hypothetical protein
VSVRILHGLTYLSYIHPCPNILSVTYRFAGDQHIFWCSNETDLLYTILIDMLDILAKRCTAYTLDSTNYLPGSNRWLAPALYMPAAHTTTASSRHRLADRAEQLNSAQLNISSSSSITNSTSATLRWRKQIAAAAEQRQVKQTQGWITHADQITTGSQLNASNNRKDVNNKAYSRSRKNPPGKLLAYLLASLAISNNDSNRGQ